LQNRPQEPHYIDLRQCPNAVIVDNVWFLEIDNLPQDISTHQLYNILVHGFLVEEKSIRYIFVEYDERDKAVTALRRATPRFVLMLDTPETLCTLLCHSVLIVQGILQLFPGHRKDIYLSSSNVTSALLVTPPPCIPRGMGPQALTAPQFQYLSASDTVPDWPSPRQSSNRYQMTPHLPVSPSRPPLGAAWASSQDTDMRRESPKRSRQSEPIAEGIATGVSSVSLPRVRTPAEDLVLSMNKVERLVLQYPEHLAIFNEWTEHLLKSPDWLSMHQSQCSTTQDQLLSLQSLSSTASDFQEVDSETTMEIGFGSGS